MTTLSISPGATPDASAAVARPRRCVMQVTWSLVAGGAETYALTIASGLDSARYRSVMCGVDQGGALEGEITRRGIPWTVMNRRPGIDWPLMWRMFKLFRREKVDVIHTHHFNQLFYSLIPARLQGIRIIHTEHSVEVYKRPHLRLALKMMSLLCYRVTAIGSDGQQVLSKRVGISHRRLRVIRAAVDLSRFQINAAVARQQLGLRPEHQVVTIVARLYPEKNHQLLLAAFQQVAAKLPDARLLIVGDGIEQQSITSRIAALGLQQQVQMLGVRSDVPLILAASDLSVLCSNREGLPIAVLEAMAASRPVVATRVGDLPLVVNDGETGLLVDAGDVKALADAIMSLLCDRTRARQLGQQGRQLVESQYSLSGMLRGHAELYG